MKGACGRLFGFFLAKLWRAWYNKRKKEVAR